MRGKSVVEDAREVARARELIELDARLQVLESETALSRERLLRLYKELKHRSPPKGVPRWMLRRSAVSSASVCGALTSAN